LLDKVGKESKKINGVWAYGCDKKDIKGSWKD